MFDFQKWKCDVLSLTNVNILKFKKINTYPCLFTSLSLQVGVDVEANLCSYFKGVSIKEMLISISSIQLGLHLVQYGIIMFIILITTDVVVKGSFITLSILMLLVGISGMLFGKNELILAKLFYFSVLANSMCKYCFRFRFSYCFQ